MLVGFTTVDDREAAHRIAASLLDETPVACVQVSESPVVSYYRWKGKSERTPEFVVTVKFVATHAASVEKRLRELHPYETPQWYAVRAEVVSPDYMAWASAPRA